MQVLRRKSIILGMFSVTGLGACSWLVYRQIYPLFYTSLIITMLILICFYQQQQKLKTAQLIVENAILTTFSYIIAGDTMDQSSQLIPDESVEVIISCFGILSGDEAYKFNYDGIRLFSVEINPEDMLFIFGTDKWKKYLRFGHDISSLEQIWEIAEDLRYETGVSSIITGWNTE